MGTGFVRVYRALCKYALNNVTVFKTSVCRWMSVDISSELDGERWWCWTKSTVVYCHSPFSPPTNCMSTKTWNGLPMVRRRLSNCAHRWDTHNTVAIPDLQQESDGRASGLLSPASRAKVLVVCLVGGRAGCIPNTQLIFKSKQKTRDYHNEFFVSFIVPPVYYRL